MITHVAKRIGLIVLGYVAAMVVIAVPVWRVTLVTGPTAYYWTEDGTVVGPEYTGLILALTDMLLYPFLPALIVILAAEIFRWHHLWVYLVGWLLILAVVTASAPLTLSPAATMAANLSAVLGGFVYWVIAGRHAGGPMKGATA